MLRLSSSSPATRTYCPGPATTIHRSQGREAEQHTSTNVSYCRIPGSAVQNQEIATAHDVQTDLSHILNACEDRLYILLAQPGLRAEDVRNAKQMPGLSGRVEKMASGSGGGKVWEIPNVIGSVDLEAVALEGASGCANAGMRMYEKEEDGGAWRGEHEAKGMMVTVPKMQFDLTQTRTEEERTRMLSETGKATNQTSRHSLARHTRA